MDNPTPKTQAAPSDAEHGRDRLLDASCELLAELPVRQITVRRIAERAGVAHSLITRHYGSRDRLLTIAISTTLVNLASQIHQAPDIYSAVTLALDRTTHSRELTSTINLITLGTTGVEQEARGFPVAEAFADHLEAGGVDHRAAKGLAATLTLMIFSWAATERRWLAMTGYADDPTAGRSAFLDTLFALVGSSTPVPPPSQTPSSSGG